MALYLGNTKITPTFGDNPLWWGKNGVEPEFLYETNYSVFLKDMTAHDSMAPTTSEKTLSHPAGLFSYTNDAGTVTNSAAGNNVVFDRYGDGYHNGETFDFEKYYYVTIADGLSEDKYTVTENTMNLIHTLKNTYTSIAYFCLGFQTKTDGSILSYGDSGYTPYIASVGITRYYNFYRNSSNNIIGYNNSYAGVYILPYGTGLSSSSSLTPAYINFYTPYFRYRVNTTLHVATAFNNLDHNTTYVKQRLRLYRIKKEKTMAEFLYDRQKYMFLNNSFPTELL